jgi:hypothetical protein
MVKQPAARGRALIFGRFHLRRDALLRPKACVKG